jgi:SAM-dependent methyltransferase
MSVEAFCDRLALIYHLIYPDWEASIRTQALALDSLIGEHWGEGKLRILDVACGIGTQTLGLAGLGHAVTASDLSPAAIERARVEAAKRGLAIDFSVADMRVLPARFREQFDLVIACDNAVPHLLSDGELLQAFEPMFVCTRPGGGCRLTVRDYDREERAGVQMKPSGARELGGKRDLIFQVWDFDGPCYDLAMDFVEDQGGPSCSARDVRSRYYAVGTGTLLALLERAGFRDVQRLDGRFYQPVLLGKRGWPGGSIRGGPPWSGESGVPDSKALMETHPSLARPESGHDGPGPC